MRLKRGLSYIILACIQLLLCAYSFNTFFHHPKGVMFSDRADGIKNYFTLQSYIKAPIGSGGLFRYDAGVYPYGEYVYYTDNTPLFSVPFRFFCQHIRDISPWGPTVFNCFIIANIILCSLLVYHVFSYLLGERQLSFFLALVLPWTNMAILRIERGHFNLSASTLIVAAICLLVLWHKHRQRPGRQVGILAGMCLLTIVGFLTHGYFLAILSLFLFFMLVFYGWYHRKEAAGKRALIHSVTYAICSVGLVVLILMATDRYLLLRKPGAMGYDFSEQKTCFSALFSHYSFNTVYFPVASIDITDDPEKAAYLGNTGLYLLVICVAAAAFVPKTRSTLKNIMTSFFRHPLLPAVFMSGVVLLSVSMGEHYATTTDHNAYLFTNIFNPFFYLHLLTNRVEQFRFLERFIFPFYFGFYLLVGYVLLAIYRNCAAKYKVSLMAAVLLLGGVEVKDTLAHVRDSVNSVNILDEASLAQLPMPHLDMSRYQASLPIPYYCVGSEDYDYTIDADQRWNLYNDQFCLRSGLPSMAFGLSRVPPSHNISLLRYVATDSVDNDLYRRLNNKPILVMVDRRLLSDTGRMIIPQRKIGRQYYWQTLSFVSRHNLSPIDSAGEIIFYEWYPKKG